VECLVHVPYIGRATASGGGNPAKPSPHLKDTKLAFSGAIVGHVINAAPLNAPFSR
jgi:hypothetical protein